MPISKLLGTNEGNIKEKETPQLKHNAYSACEYNQLNARRAKCT